MAASAEHLDAPPRRRLALVMNAQAGSLLGQPDQAGALESQLRQVASELHVVPAEAGSLPERVDQARASGADCVVVAGGDGTIACAAQALAGTGISLALIPGGTMNLLARDLRIDPADRQGAVRLLADGTERAIDVAELSAEGEPPMLFLCASMLGTPARLSRHREAGRQMGNGVLGWGLFGWAALRALARNRSLRLTLRCNGRVLKRRTPSLTITVNPLDDAAGRLFGRTCLDGGELALYLVPRSSIFAQAWLLLRTAITGNLRRPEIEVIRTRALEVEARGAALHVLIDGELRLLRPPLRYQVRPGALRVIAPA
jgi:diacylglycerol kinase family enzyme